LHATSNGKVLLGGLSDGEVVALVGRRPRTYTSATLGTSAAVLADVAEARDQGYALAVDELEVGLAAVAAPIRNVHGDVVASVSVSGPTFRLEGAAMTAATEAVVETADEVSRRLGWRVSTPQRLAGSA
jgi:DNA-binding IclR family transcriptional regulator